MEHDLDRPVPHRRGIDCCGNMGSKMAMRLVRRSRRMARSRLLVLLLAGMAVGILGGLQVAGMIERAGAGGMFGGSLLPPAEVRSAKPSEQDRLMGAALAAALGADQLSDCRSLEPRHQAGCRAYLQQRESRDDILGTFVPPRTGNQLAPAVPANGSSSAADGPVSFDRAAR